jgi:hypothetical protein
MFDKLREKITGQVAVDVPDHVQNVPSYVASQLKNRGLEVDAESQLKCDKCRRWFAFHDFAVHSC